MDLILQYPNAETVFVGFFMMDKKWQGKRVGSSIIQELCNYFMKDYSFIRLAYVEGNKQAEGFWVKNGFHPTGDKKSTEAYTVIVMQKEL
jgi:tRNA(Met) C34 N-acetyltransferase TmcA